MHDAHDFWMLALEALRKSEGRCILTSAAVTAEFDIFVIVVVASRHSTYFFPLFAQSSRPCDCDECTHFVERLCEPAGRVLAVVCLRGVEVSVAGGSRLVDSVFGGKLRTTTTCSCCGHTSSAVDQVIDLSLPLHRPAPEITRVSLHPHHDGAEWMIRL